MSLEAQTKIQFRRCHCFAIFGKQSKKHYIKFHLTKYAEIILQLFSHLTLTGHGKIFSHYGRTCKHSLQILHPLALLELPHS